MVSRTSCLNYAMYDIKTLRKMFPNRKKKHELLLTISFVEGVSSNGPTSPPKKCFCPKMCLYFQSWNEWQFFKYLKKKLPTKTGAFVNWQKISGEVKKNLYKHWLASLPVPPFILTLTRRFPCPDCRGMFILLFIDTTALTDSQLGAGTFVAMHVSST